jgi:hypothetical protein
MYLLNQGANEMIKIYSIQYTSPESYGALCVSARTAREARAYLQKHCPGAVITSFAVEV